MTISDIMELVKEYGKQKARDWWDSWQTFLQSVQTWRDSASDKLHPWLRIPLLALIDTVYCCLVGVGFIALLLACFITSCLFMLIVMAPFLIVASWLSSYLLPPVDKAFHPTIYVRHAILVFASVILYCILYLMNWRVQKTDPESDLTDFFANYVERLPTFPSIVVTYFLWIVVSACFVVFAFDFTLGVGWAFVAISCFLYYFFQLCYLLILYVPSYVLIPVTVFLPLFFYSLLRRVQSCSETVDENGEPQSPHSAESMYGDIQSSLLA